MQVAHILQVVTLVQAVNDRQAEHVSKFVQIVLQQTNCATTN